MEKKYYKCTVTAHDGRVFENPLKMSEINILGTIIQDNKKVECRVATCTNEQYKSIFG